MSYRLCFTGEEFEEEGQLELDSDMTVGDMETLENQLIQVLERMSEGTESQQDFALAFLTMVTNIYNYFGEDDDAKMN
jgi:hypothetical protein